MYISHGSSATTYLQLFFTLLILVALLWYLHTGRLRYALIAGIGVAGGMALKEDMPLFLLVFLIAGLYLLVAKKITLPKTWKRDAVLGLLLAVGLLAPPLFIIRGSIPRSSKPG